VFALLLSLMGALSISTAPSGMAGGSSGPMTSSMRCDARRYLLLFSPKGREQVVRGERYVGPAFAELYEDTNQPGATPTYVADAEAGGSTGYKFPPPAGCSQLTVAHVAHEVESRSPLTQSNTATTLSCTFPAASTVQMWRTVSASAPSTGITLVFRHQTVADAKLSDLGLSTYQATLSYSGKFCKASAFRDDLKPVAQ
jgi:hypothetical protein